MRLSVLLVCIALGVVAVFARHPKPPTSEVSVDRVIQDVEAVESDLKVFHKHLEQFKAKSHVAQAAAVDNDNDEDQDNDNDVPKAKVVSKKSNKVQAKKRASFKSVGDEDADMDDAESGLEATKGWMDTIADKAKSVLGFEEDPNAQADEDADEKATADTTQTKTVKESNNDMEEDDDEDKPVTLHRKRHNNKNQKGATKAKAKKSNEQAGLLDNIFGEKDAEEDDVENAIETKGNESLTATTASDDDVPAKTAANDNDDDN